MTQRGVQEGESSGLIDQGLGFGVQKVGLGAWGPVRNSSEKANSSTACAGCGI